jgi:hypothetical protein
MNSERQRFELWAQDNVGQPDFSGKFIRDSIWCYNHNFIRMCWECWQAAIKKE